MKIEVNIGKGHAIALGSILAIFTGIMFVVSYGGNQPSVMGHTWSEIGLPTGSEAGPHGEWVGLNADMVDGKHASELGPRECRIERKICIGSRDSVESCTATCNSDEYILSGGGSAQGSDFFTTRPLSAGLGGSWYISGNTFYGHWDTIGDGVDDMHAYAVTAYALCCKL